MIKTFKIVSWIEWTSFIVLLIAVVNKYVFQGDPMIVTYLGRTHGFLFIAYIVLAYLVKDECKLSTKNFLMLCLMAALPFGVFLIHRYLKPTK